MLNLMENINNNIPTNFIYDFQWVAEYNDGTLLTEYSPKYNPKTTDFYSIDKNKLLRFGYIGHGLRAYFNTYNGVFNINKSQYRLYFKYNNTKYNITEMLGVNYNDIIQFKRRTAFFNPLNGQMSGTMDKNCIDSYNIGWKTKFNIGNIFFNITTYYQINRNGLPLLYIKIVPNQDFQNAEIVITKDDLIEYNYPCSMKKDIGGEMNWVVR